MKVRPPKIVHTLSEPCFGVWHYFDQGIAGYVGNFSRMLAVNSEGPWAVHMNAKSL